MTSRDEPPNRAHVVPRNRSPPPIDAASIDILASDHLTTLIRALTRVLDTGAARFTYAQIIDGLPTQESLHEFQTPREGHPVIQLGHNELCEGVLEKTREFRQNFDVSSLKFPLTLLNSFQGTKPESKPFHLRLIELLAVACHQIAVFLFQLDDGIHKHSEYENWRTGPLGADSYELLRAPVVFCHNRYTNFAEYPNGVADCVGYWAEAKMFGGVVVFDRGESETECNDMFIHGSNADGPTTIYAPTSEQFKNLIAFLEDPDDGAVQRCPLPIQATFLNRYRWDPRAAIADFHIFRDRYERKVGPEPRRRCVRSANDWPELTDDIMIMNAMFSERQGQPVDQEEVAARRARMRQITPSSPCWSACMIYRGVEWDE